MAANSLGRDSKDKSESRRKHSTSTSMMNPT